MWPTPPVHQCQQYPQVEWPHQTAVLKATPCAMGTSRATETLLLGLPTRTSCSARTFVTPILAAAASGGVPLKGSVVKTSSVTPVEVIIATIYSVQKKVMSITWVDTCTAGGSCFRSYFHVSAGNPIPNEGRTIEASAEACQARCASVKDCRVFGIWPNGGCHIENQIGQMIPSNNEHEIWGHKDCAGSVDWLLLNVLSMSTPFYHTWIFAAYGRSF